MSVDLDWSLLTPNSPPPSSQNSTTHSPSSPSPDLLGPIHCHSFHFGDVPPEITLVDIKDVSRSMREAADAGEWERSGGEGGDSLDGEAMHGLGGGGGPLPREGDMKRDQASRPPLSRMDSVDWRSQDSPPYPHTSSPTRPPTPPPSPHDPPGTTSTSQPSLQLHLHITYSGNLRLDFSASLVMNHPSQGFMGLPLRMSVVAVAFDAEVVVALEADRGRVHVTLVEPEGGEEEGDGGADGERGGGDVGARILPEMVIETEVGEAEKHVLRNVSKVERLIVEMVRKLLCDELVYPNFHTMEWG